MFSIIVAETNKHGIGYNGRLPWSVPEDMRHFARMTKGCTVIMGRNTWESLPFRPLPNRKNVVITSKRIEGVERFACLDEALSVTTDDNKVWVIGGARLYNEAAHHLSCESIVVTKIQGEYECDTHWCGVPNHLFALDKSEGIFHTYKRI